MTKPMSNPLGKIATREEMLSAETQRLRRLGYPRKIARKMARRACGYAS